MTVSQPHLTKAAAATTNDESSDNETASNDDESSDTGITTSNNVAVSGLNASAKEFVPTTTLSGSEITSSSEEVPFEEVRQCARCGKAYAVDAASGDTLGPREKCLYHWGKVRYGSVVSGEADRYSTVIIYISIT